MVEELVGHMESGTDIQVEVDHMVEWEVIEHIPAVLVEHIQVENTPVVLADIQVEVEVEVEHKRIEALKEECQHKWVDSM